jgi:lipoate-protein ligase B
VFFSFIVDLNQMISSESSVWTLPNRQADALEVYLLGCVDFESAFHIQQRAVHNLADRNDRLGTLLLCEHPATITIGRDGSESEINVADGDAVARQIGIHRVARNGGVSLHGVGQLTAYLNIPLNRVGLSADEYVNLLGSVLVKTCAEQGVATEFICDQRPGVVGRCGQLGWIASGLARVEPVNQTSGEDVSDYLSRRDCISSCEQINESITTFGLSLNVGADLLLQRLLNSSNGRPVSSLAMHRMQMTPMHKVRESLIRQLANALGYPEFYLHTRHPLLKRSRKKIVQYA